MPSRRLDAHGATAQRRNGATIIEHFDEQLGAEAADRHERRVEFRRAISNGELEVHYQSVHHAHSHQIVGIEALARWRHPTQGLLTPDVFIPDAEELGLIVQFGDAIRKTALADASRWIEVLDDDAIPLLSINASAAELTLIDYAQRVVDDLEAAGVAGHHLCIEVTETSLISDPVIAGATLRSLADHGVKIALDDFGTGYSTLDFLRRFPVDIVKIDKSFTAAITHEQTDLILVTAILDLAKSLRKTTVAEGIETRSQLDVVTGLGADQVQGYFFSKPVSQTAMAAILTPQALMGPREPEPVEPLPLQAGSAS